MRSVARTSVPSMSRKLRADPIELAIENWLARKWDAAAGGMAIVTSVMRVQQIFASEVEAVLRPLGLTFARYEVLMLLDFSRSGQLPLGKIGERLQVHPASVTNAVDRLESDGLVARTPNPGDGRSTLASISQAGRELASVASASLNERVFARVALTATEQRDAFRLLGQIRHAAGDYT
jgi:DNA-binding MarR family transcriptional regulator